MIQYQKLKNLKNTWKLLEKYLIYFNIILIIFLLKKIKSIDFS